MRLGLLALGALSGAHQKQTVCLIRKDQPAETEVVSDQPAETEVKSLPVEGLTERQKVIATLALQIDGVITTSGACKETFGAQLTDPNSNCEIKVIGDNVKIHEHKGPVDDASAQKRSQKANKDVQQVHPEV